jgi:hypothetical protein
MTSVTKLLNLNDDNEELHTWEKYKKDLSGFLGVNNTIQVMFAKNYQAKSTFLTS